MKKLANLSLADGLRILKGFPDLPTSMVYPASMTPVNLLLFLMPEVTRPQAEARRVEFLKDHRFFNALNDKMIEKRRRHVSWPEWIEFLYLAVRFAKPRIMVETGVFDGRSSAVILRALEENGSGELISIDLPAVKPIKGSTDSFPNSTLPPGCDPGWLVPEYLRSRYTLMLGDSKSYLPQVFAKHGQVDIFFHDSLHTFAHQYFEYETAWPHLPENGLLISDAVLFSHAFHKFLKDQGKPYGHIEGFGAARK